MVAIALEKGRQYPLKIEWNPDGDESYLGLKWLSPLLGQCRQEVGLQSEAGPSLDYYFVRGRNLDEVIGGYRQLTPVYNSLRAKGYLCPRNIANRTKDWTAPGYTSTFYDAFNPQARQAFWDLLNTKLFAKGIDAWWMDASEPDIYSNANVQTRKELMTPTAIGPAAQYFNGFPPQNAKGIYEGQRQAAPARATPAPSATRRPSGAATLPRAGRTSATRFRPV